MKTLRTIIILLLVLFPISCDEIFNILTEDCEKENIGWVRFENASSSYTFDIYMDDYFKCRLNPYQTSYYYAIDVFWSHSVEWKCYDCNGHVSECESSSYVDVDKCEHITYNCSD